MIKKVGNEQNYNCDDNYKENNLNLNNDNYDEKYQQDEINQNPNDDRLNMNNILQNKNNMNNIQINMKIIEKILVKIMKLKMRYIIIIIKQLQILIMKP